jgi:hypothetical protein
VCTPPPYLGKIGSSNQVEWIVHGILYMLQFTVSACTQAKTPTVCVFVFSSRVDVAAANGGEHTQNKHNTASTAGRWKTAAGERLVAVGRWTVDGGWVG